MTQSLGIPAILAVIPPAMADHELVESKIRPVLAKPCVRCHGPDKASGGLRLDSGEALIRGGKQGPIGDHDHPEVSLLLKAIGRVDEEIAAMAPDIHLGADAVANLRRWVEAGMPWLDLASPIQAVRHWAFEPVRAVEPPTKRSIPLMDFSRPIFDRKVWSPSDQRTNEL